MCGIYFHREGYVRLTAAVSDTLSPGECKRVARHPSSVLQAVDQGLATEALVRLATALCSDSQTAELRVEHSSPSWPGWSPSSILCLPDAFNIVVGSRHAPIDVSWHMLLLAKFMEGRAYIRVVQHQRGGLSPPLSGRAFHRYQSHGKIALPLPARKPSLRYGWAIPTAWGERV